MTTDLAYIFAAILLPFIPAYVIYKTLPKTTTRVIGPFKGLNIQLGGAFGGYFLLVVSIFTFVASRPRPSLDYEVYTVKGRIDFQEGNPKDTYFIVPSQLAVTPDGSFEISIPVRRDQTEEPEYPRLVIAHPEYKPATIDLEKSQATQDGSVSHYTVLCDSWKKIISIDGDIHLERKPSIGPYSPDTGLVANMKETSHEN